MIVTNIRTNWLYDVPTVNGPPRFSWENRSALRGDAQTAYQVQCSITTSGAELWDSGKLTSTAQVAVYAGLTLTSRQRVFWRIRVWDAAGNPSQWATGRFNVGLLSIAEWGSALWIGYQTGSVADSAPAFGVRKGFTTQPKTVANATLYASARGFYIPCLNGERLGQSEMTPGWTKFGTRHQYQSYDVTNKIKADAANALGFKVGDGWYHGRLLVTPSGFSVIRNYYGADMPRVIGTLIVEYSDGTIDQISTDATWTAVTHEVLANDIYNGTSLDASRAGVFATTAFSAATLPVTTVAFGSIVLQAQQHPHIKRQGIYPALARTNPSTGSYIFDMGVIRPGTCRLIVRGATAGQVVTLQHAQDIYRSGGNIGKLETTNNRSAANTDSVTCAGLAEEIFEFPFTYHAFRYVQVTGYPGVPAMDAVSAIELFADRRSTISFDCSNTLLNTLFANARRSHHVNSLAVMSDCGDRDERLCWNGDGSLSMGAFLLQRDNFAFMQSMLDCVQDDVDALGRARITTPYQGEPASPGCAAGGEISAFLPASLYIATGDSTFLSGSYLTNLRKMLDALPGPDAYNDYLHTDAATDSTLFSNAFGYKVASIVQQAAAIAGDTTTASQAAAKAASCLAAARARINADGTIISDSQCAYVLALAFKVVTPALRAASAARLRTLIQTNGLQVGLIGFTFLFDALTEGGLTDVAYSTILQTARPSIGFDAINGVTAVAEYLDPLSRQGQRENSYSHQIRTEYLGWMVRSIAGINTDPTAPAYSNIILRAQPGGGVSYVNCRHDSVRGPIESNWRLAGAKMAWSVVIPAGSTATFVLPPGYTTALAGVTAIGSLPGVAALAADSVNGQPRWSLPSGSYSFLIS